MGEDVAAGSAISERTQRIVRPGALILQAGISAALLIPRLQNWPLTPDFTMLWAGARFAVVSPHETYDWAAVTAAQMSLRPPVGPLPFPYPPSALPLMAPFGLLPFWPALWAWTTLSATAFWTAARRITSSPLLVFIMPRMVLAIVLGHAIRYELGMLAPSLLDALFAGTVRGLLVALPLYCLNLLTIVPALLISACTAAFRTR